MKSPRFRYKIIGSPLNFTSLQSKVKDISNQDWSRWKERQVFEEQKDSLSILLYNSQPDIKSRVFKTKVINNYFISLLKDELWECFKLINLEYADGEPKRVMLVNLPAGKNVEPHIDASEHAAKCRRVHLPIITNDKVKFFCMDSTIPMNEGVLTEFNNTVIHSVINTSTEDRLHLVIDWGHAEDPSNIKYME